MIDYGRADGKGETAMNLIPDMGLKDGHTIVDQVS